MNITIDKDSKFERKGGGKIQINARYRLEPPKGQVPGRPGILEAYDVIDRALEIQFLPAVIFSNGTEQECREWVLRNCEEPVEHTPEPWEIFRPKPSLINEISIIGRSTRGWIHQTVAEVFVQNGTPRSESEANAALLKTAPKLLALLEQYHQSFPSKASGKLICEARNWQI